MKHIVRGAHVICVSVKTFKFDNVKTAVPVTVTKDSQAPIKFNGLWPIVQK